MSKYKIFGSTTQELKLPQDKPQYNLDLVNSQSIPPEYTFTRNSSGTYVDTDGYIKTAAANEPRFDHDSSTGEFRGLLVEEARTNLVTYSEQFNSASWSKLSTTVTPNAITAPDGTVTSDQIDHQSQTGNWSIVFQSSIGGGGSNVFSVYLRCANGQTVTNYKLSAGSTNTTVTVTDEWQRFSLAYTGSQDIRLGNLYGESSPARTVYAWGAQVETGSFPTSYIPTTTSTVTRQPDQLILNKPFNSLGTFFVESNQTRGITLSADNGTSGLVMSSTGKDALYYNTNRTLIMSSDSSLELFNSSAPQDLNRVSLGHNALYNSSYINGYLKKFMYYGSPVTEDNLRSLTGNTLDTYRYNNTDIVTNGLVLNLDAGNPASYPGTGTTWTDLSGNGNNGTLEGAGYNSANGGSISFDGSNDYVNLGSFFNYQTFTIEIWVNPGTTQITYADIFDNYHTGFQNFVLQQNASNLNQYSFGVADASGGISSSGTIILTANTWTHVAFTFSPSTRVIAYINGAFHNRGNLASGRTINYVSPNLSLGRWSYGNSRFWNGKISNFKTYNRILTASEIQQNFNALRGRFGI